MVWQGMDVQAGGTLDFFLGTSAQKKNRDVLCIPPCCLDERLELCALIWSRACGLLT